MTDYISRKVLHLAIPSIVTNITIPLLGLVDMAITGHMGNALYMAAIAIGTMFFNIIYWLFTFIRFGTGGMTAQNIGSENTHECCLILLRAQLACLFISILLTIVQWPIFQLMLWLIHPDGTLITTIQTYYTICIWGVWPSLALYAFTGWFVGMQNTTIPMLVSICQNIVNILLSLLFVYYFQMKIEGIALGTLIAQWAGAIMALGLLKLKYGHLWKNINIQEIFHWKSIKHFFRINSTLFYRTLFLIIVNFYFIAIGTHSGTKIVAVNAVIMQMFILFSYVMDGFAFAAEALCGKYYGANDSIHFHQSIKNIWRWALLVTSLYTLAYSIGAEQFLQVLTNDTHILLLASDYLFWAILIPVSGMAAFVWDGVFVGITNVKGMLWSTALGSITFLILCQLLWPLYGNHALWFSFILYLAIRGIVETAIYYCQRPFK